MKKIRFLGMAAALAASVALASCKSPIAADPPLPAIDDGLASTSLMYQPLSGFSFDSTSVSQFLDDASRLTRGTAATPEFVYRLADDMESFRMVAWFWVGESLIDFDFYTSTEGSAWKACYPATEQSLPTPAWTRVLYEKEALPAGTRYLKVVFRKTAGQTWNPQVGSVKIY